ncbi:MAG: tol-pal system-associated acyl-CoA thioesterase [Thiotrichaceae bacterium]|nr:tol-pal system-associated acyl-CoA thioesterase [Thiotrichaceae bacterium]
MNTSYSLPIRIYYEDTDAGGIVYYANYLKFMERARTEWLRDGNIEQDQLRDEFGLIFVVRSVNIDYLKPAVFNDLIDVSVSIKVLGKTHLIVSQQAVRAQERLCTAEVGLVCIDAQHFRPRRIPPIIRDWIEKK